MRLKRYCALLALAATPMFAQEFRGTVSGTITDPSGGKVANVKLTATETRTGATTMAQSDAAGDYTIPFLAPGIYRITAESTGFKRYVHDNLEVGPGDHPVLDVRLELGETTQSVTVTEEVPLLNSENASMGQTITTKQVEDLPLNGRTPAMLAQLSIGVIATAQPSLVHPFDNAGAAAWSIGGTPSQSSELLMDGAPDATWDQRLAYSPTQDSVQQVVVNAFDTDAAYGHTAGGTINQIMKGGTNSFHGSMYEFSQASRLDAVNFFTNKTGAAVPVTHFNQYGLTAGAPVIIPKVFNGRNKLFWFFAWENLADAQPNNSTLSTSTSNFTTVPTSAERMGNFSALNYTLYNPFSAVLSGSSVTRSPLAGNIIPPTMLDPVAQAYLQYYPMPNTPPLGANGFENYVSGFLSTDTYDNELGRIDYNMSSRSHLSFDMRHNYRIQDKGNYFNNIATGTDLTRENWGATVDEVYTISPTAFADVRFNFTRMNEVHAEPSEGFNPTTLGYPSYIAANSQYLVMPYVQFGSCGSQTSFQCLGDNSASRDPSQSYQLFGAVTKIVGKHTFKFGEDIRQYRLNTYITGNSAGSYTFGNGWVRAANSSSSTVQVGQDFASFLMGLPTAGQFDINSHASWSSYYFSGFVQDDWRISRTLTVNLGLRFDQDLPYAEKYGRTVNNFNVDATSPIAAAAMTAYAANPIPQLPAASFMVPGGLTFPSASNGDPYQTTSHLFSPRAGFAWSPSALHSKTVIRGGFGMFVAPVTVASLATTGAYSSNPLVDQEGFSQTTTMLVPTNFLTPSATLSSPFPGGILHPVGSSEGLSTFLGQTVSFLNPDMKNPYSLRWNFGVQQSLTKNTLLEVEYMGNHSVDLPIAFTQLNTIPRQYLSTLPTRDQTTISALTATVPNPFAGLEPGTSLNNSTTTVEQLLARYPEFPVGSGSGSTGVIEQNLSDGRSFFESVSVRLEKRLSYGLSVIGNYMYSRLIEQDTWLNDTDPEPEKRISPFDHPNHFVVGATYLLPVGKNRIVNLKSRWTNAILGGWTVNGIYTYQTGAPLVWTNGSTTNIGDYVYLGGPLNLNSNQVNGTAFNTAEFDTKAADQYQFHIRTFSTTFPNLRQAGINNLDASLMKQIQIRESMYLQLRLEAFNAVNHPVFGAPVTTISSSTFGEITSQGNLPRQIQLGGRFVW
ncbi:MAG TPA: carboxypeptidase-like regulatory domain-containing protein [Bryobacteraceae bacterium]